MYELLLTYIDPHGSGDGAWRGKISLIIDGRLSTCSYNGSNDYWVSYSDWNVRWRGFDVNYGALKKNYILLDCDVNYSETTSLIEPFPLKPSCDVNENCNANEFNITWIKYETLESKGQVQDEIEFLVLTDIRRNWEQSNILCNAFSGKTASLLKDVG